MCVCVCFHFLKIFVHKVTFYLKRTTLTQSPEEERVEGEEGEEATDTQLKDLK